MLGNPTVFVMCDTEGCDSEDTVDLTALAKGAYDERGIESDLKDMGWSIVDGKHLCCNCTEERERLLAAATLVPDEKLGA